MTWEGVPSYEEMADELFKLQSSENEGRGVNCVRGIVNHLRACNGKDAKAVCRNEWDKIRNYPKIVEWLFKNKVVAESEVYWHYKDS